MKTNQIINTFKHNLSWLLCFIAFFAISQGSTAATWSFSGGRIYFDNSTTQWNDSYIYLLIGKSGESSYTSVYQMTKDGSRYYVDLPSSEWGDATYMAVVGTSSSWDSGSFGPTHRENANHYTNEYTSGISSSSYHNYLLTPSSSDNNCNIKLNMIYYVAGNGSGHSDGWCDNKDWNPSGSEMTGSGTADDPATITFSNVSRNQNLLFEVTDGTSSGVYGWNKVSGYKSTIYDGSNKLAGGDNMWYITSAKLLTDGVRNITINWDGTNIYVVTKNPEEIYSIAGSFTNWDTNKVQMEKQSSGTYSGKYTCDIELSSSGSFKLKNSKGQWLGRDSAIITSSKDTLQNLTFPSDGDKGGNISIELNGSGTYKFVYDGSTLKVVYPQTCPDIAAPAIGAITFPSCYVHTVGLSGKTSDYFFLVQYEGESPVITNPTNGTQYNVGDVLGSGKVIATQEQGAQKSYISVDADKKYTYALYQYSSQFCYSSADTKTSTMGVPEVATLNAVVNEGKATLGGEYVEVGQNQGIIGYGIQWTKTVGDKTKDDYVNFGETWPTKGNDFTKEITFSSSGTYYYRAYIKTAARDSSDCQYGYGEEKAVTIAEIPGPDNLYIKGPLYLDWADSYQHGQPEGGYTHDGNTYTFSFRATNAGGFYNEPLQFVISTTNDNAHEQKINGNMADSENEGWGFVSDSNNNFKASSDIVTGTSVPIVITVTFHPETGKYSMILESSCTDPTASQFTYTNPKTYNGSSQSADVAWHDPAVSGVITEYYKVKDSSNEYTSDAPTNAGTYTLAIKAEAAGSYCAVTDYLVLGDYTINKADQAADVRITNEIKNVCVGSNLSLAAEGGDEGAGDYTFAITGPVGYSSIAEIVNGELRGLSAGTVNVVATRSGGANYNDKTSAAVEFTVESSFSVDEISLTGEPEWLCAPDGNAGTLSVNNITGATYDWRSSVPSGVELRKVSDTNPPEYQRYIHLGAIDADVTFMVTVSKGACSVTKTKESTIYRRPDAVTSVSATPVCGAGGSSTLTITSDASMFQWFDYEKKKIGDPTDSKTLTVSNVNEYREYWVSVVDEHCYSNITLAKVYYSAKPSTPTINLTGGDNVCKDQEVSASVNSPVDNVRYTWSLESGSGWSGPTSSTGNSATFTAGAENGIIGVVPALQIKDTEEWCNGDKVTKEITVSGQGPSITPATSTVTNYKVVNLSSDVDVDTWTITNMSGNDSYFINSDANSAAFKGTVGEGDDKEFIITGATASGCAGTATITVTKDTEECN